jgi:type VII secretion protein EccB
VATRRDQLQSYQFLTQRVISAFVMRETDPAQSPLRRGIGAVFAGVMIAVLVAAGFGVYGLLTKVGSGNWKVDGAVVVEKESGATYVYDQGTLYPTINYTSALLAAGKPTPQLFKASAKSLGGVPRGPLIGIPGAPNSLPSGKNTVGAPWTLCSLIVSPSRRTVLIAGSGPAGAQQLAGGPKGQGLIVSGPGGTFLLWDGRKYHLKDANGVISALYPSVSPAEVGAAWLNGLPTGQEIAAPTVPDPGTPSQRLPGHKVGDLVFKDTANGRAYYLVYDDGLADLSDLQQRLVGADVEPQQVTPPEVTRAGQSSQLPNPGRDEAPPTTPPQLVQPTATTDPLCIQSSNANAFPSISVGGTVSERQLGTPTRSQSSEGSPLADRVSVPAGKVAVVRALASPTAVGGSLYLVTDTGMRFLVPSADVLKILGFQPEQAVEMPVNFVGRIPAGPTLDPAAAVKPVNVTGD